MGASKPVNLDDYITIRRMDTWSLFVTSDGDCVQLVAECSDRAVQVATLHDLHHEVQIFHSTPSGYTICHTETEQEDIMAYIKQHGEKFWNEVAELYAIDNTACRRGAQLREHAIPLSRSNLDAAISAALYAHIPPEHL